MPLFTGLVYWMTRRIPMAFYFTSSVYYRTTKPKPWTRQRKKNNTRLLRMWGPHANVQIFPDWKLKKKDKKAQQPRVPTFVYSLIRDSYATKGKAIRSASNRKRKKFLHAAYVPVRVMKDRAQLAARFGTIPRK
jgi:hypothetical protein